MSETALASEAVQRQFNALLATHLTDPVTNAVVPVVDQPGENQAFPYVQLCAFPEQARDTFNHVGRTVMAQVDVWIRQGPDGATDGWGQARNIAGQVDVILNSGALPAPSDGWTFTGVLFHSSKDRALGDGMTRCVMLEYTVWLETTT